MFSCCHNYPAYVDIILHVDLYFDYFMADAMKNPRRLSIFGCVLKPEAVKGGCSVLSTKVLIIIEIAEVKCMVEAKTRDIV